WELFGSRAWLVAFLVFAQARFHDGGAASWWTPALIAGAANALISPLASIAGNELSMRHGRERLIWNVMLASALFTCVLGFLAGVPWLLLAMLAMLHVGATMTDSG